MVNLLKLQQIAVLCFISLALSGCGRKGALESPPGDTSSRAQPKANAFFNPSAKIETRKDDIAPENMPLNPQLASSGQLLRAVTKVPASGATTGTDQRLGIAPVGGGRKAKRILPPDQSFILDPLL